MEKDYFVHESSYVDDDVEIGKILGKLMEMSPDELQLVKQYIEFISKK